jgi:hypothetical protein
MASAKTDVRTTTIASTTIQTLEDAASRMLTDAGAIYAAEERKRRIAKTERSIARARGSFA